MTADEIRLEFDEIELQAVPRAGEIRLEFDGIELHGVPRAGEIRLEVPRSGASCVKLGPDAWDESASG